MEANPFSGLKISSLEALQQLEGRMKCAKCGKSRKYYCSVCGLPTEKTKDKIPKIKLPVKIDIIRHPVEENGKNTAVHARVLAPDDVTLYTYPDFPDYEDKSKIILVFPSKESMTLSELACSLGKDLETTDCDSEASEQNRKDVSDHQTESLPEVPKTVMKEDMQNKAEDLPVKEKGKREFSNNENGTPAAKIPKKDSSQCDKECESEPKVPFDRVIFVDATWHYVNRIGKDERLLGVKHVELRTETTKFWRYQRNKPSTYLSTIEAIYYFLREYHDIFIDKDYTGEYDDLLFLFMLLYQKIRQETGGGDCLMAYKAEEDE